MLLLGALLAGCGNDPKAANEANFTAAIDAGLGDPGSSSVCLANVPTFPGQLSDQYAYGGAMPDSSRYDAFVRAGLAEERTVIGTQAATFFAPARHFHIKEYRLTAAGRSALTTQKNAFLGDVQGFCYASYRVGKIINFTEPEDLMGMRVTQVRWVPKVVTVADWATSDRATSALPDIKENLQTITTQEKTTALALTNTGWEIAR